MASGRVTRRITSELAFAAIAHARPQQVGTSHRTNESMAVPDCYWRRLWPGSTKTIASPGLMIGSIPSRTSVYAAQRLYLGAADLQCELSVNSSSDPVGWGRQRASESVDLVGFNFDHRCRSLPKPVTSWLLLRLVRLGGVQIPDVPVQAPALRGAVPHVHVLAA